MKAAQEEIYSPYLVARSVFSNLAGERRASSVLLPKGLAPLVIPKSSTDYPSREAYQSPSSIGDTEDLPPRVPPKSPKTLIRAFPQPGKVRETPTFTSSRSSKSHTTNSSVTSIGTVDSRTSPKPWTSPLRGRSPLSTQKTSDPNSKASKRISIQKQSELTPVNERIKTHPKQAQVESSNKSRFAASTGHQRAESETSIVNRARPMTRGETTLQRHLSRNLKLQDPIKLLTDELPQGMPLGIASHRMAPCEIRRLKQLAELNIRDFKVLNEMEVSNLTRVCDSGTRIITVANLLKEYRELDERCQYLHIFHASLRKSKCDLYGRMIGILRSPRTATFSREHLIKQEEALLDLDVSINEWLMKLNAAESRRQEVQRRLLEHTAAIMYMAGPPSPRDEASMNQQTPPRSPQGIDFSPKRRDVESIRIYADSGVASLLASIEKEINVLAEVTRES